MRPPTVHLDWRALDDPCRRPSVVPTRAGRHDRDRTRGRWRCRTAPAHRKPDRVPPPHERGGGARGDAHTRLGWVQWPILDTRPVRFRPHRTRAALPVPPPGRHQPQRHPVRTARPGDRAPRSIPGHGPGAGGCRCLTAGHRSHPIAAADSWTRMPESRCRRQPPRPWHRPRSWRVAVSRSSSPNQELQPSRRLRGTWRTRSAPTPPATSWVVTGNATERSRVFRPARVRPASVCSHVACCRRPRDVGATHRPHQGMKVRRCVARTCGVSII
jgi:hypothetical protein